MSPLEGWRRRRRRCKPELFMTKPPSLSAILSHNSSGHLGISFSGFESLLRSPTSSKLDLTMCLAIIHQPVTCWSGCIMKHSSSESSRQTDEDGRRRRMERSATGSSTGGWVHPPQEQETRGSPSNYFSMKSFLVLICLTLSLLILPLVLPPLPPPPSALLLLPIGMLVLLLILAFMPSDTGNIASSYL